MNAQQKTWLALGLGVLILVLSTIATFQASLHALSLREQINNAAQTRDAKNVEYALPKDFLLRASSHGAAGAALLTRLRTSARGAGVSLERAEPRPADPTNPNSVKISAQASGSTRAIAAFLHDIEANPPALLVERARLNTDEDNTVSIDILLAARASYGRDAP